MSTLKEGRYVTVSYTSASTHGGRITETTRIVAKNPITGDVKLAGYEHIGWIKGDPDGYRIEDATILDMLHARLNASRPIYEQQRRGGSPSGEAYWDGRVSLLEELIQYLEEGD